MFVHKCKQQPTALHNCGNETVWIGQYTLKASGDERRDLKCWFYFNKGVAILPKKAYSVMENFL